MDTQGRVRVWVADYPGLALILTPGPLPLHLDIELDDLIHRPFPSSDARYAAATARVRDWSTRDPDQLNMFDRARLLERFKRTP